MCQKSHVIFFFGQSGEVYRDKSLILFRTDAVIHSVQSFFSSVDLGSVIDAKLKVNYVGGDKDKEKLKVKRKAIFTEGAPVKKKHPVNTFTHFHLYCVHLYTCSSPL